MKLLTNEQSDIIRGLNDFLTYSKMTPAKKDNCITTRIAEQFAYHAALPTSGNLSWSNYWETFHSANIRTQISRIGEHVNIDAEAVYNLTQEIFKLRFNLVFHPTQINLAKLADCGVVSNIHSKYLDESFNKSLTYVVMTAWGE